MVKLGWIDSVCEDTVWGVEWSSNDMMDQRLAYPCYVSIVRCPEDNIYSKCNQLFRKERVD
ncbi:hypothetical protein MYP_847 [Sporocytophaga myxococcoides]|uniref:Uncharacterized protein n=1 Tax=Sporocytophaga myxococcoides TaxID=153721 RepID=A0A098L9L4_9BACT|nr:hypothetical protein [Sporocytophaga myxococcoides]GAL83620.1 hypothetical protein MYP_847 [Sporocytophaga myxococcoides]